MRISLAALHEGDLLRLLDDLRQHAGPWAHIQRCGLKRDTAPRALGAQRPAPQLAAECELLMLTAREKGTP
jgi:hypothetical protein